jgi:hypothetical protein
VESTSAHCVAVSVSDSVQLVASGPVSVLQHAARALHPVALPVPGPPSAPSPFARLLLHPSTDVASPVTISSVTTNRRELIGGASL